MVPSKALLQSAANQDVVDSMIAQLYLRHQGAAAAEWDDWSQIRTAIEDILIIDARPGMRYFCTCYQSKQAKKKKKTCDHSLGVELLVQGHLGPYQIQDLLDFGPKSVGRPKYDTTAALEIDDAHRERGEQIDNNMARGPPNAVILPPRRARRYVQSLRPSQATAHNLLKYSHAQAGGDNDVDRSPEADDNTVLGDGSSATASPIQIRTPPLRKRLRKKNRPDYQQMEYGRTVLVKRRQSTPSPLCEPHP
ncbi:hypothetical protein FOZ62_000602 [Perkinsus olseni]|uniref:SWIM-type domain-containing protein n=1 Tax=Perkinsus olseni TaxID=32597 RepID=A0A7J6U6E3_PEROL|nr:hypothetical protein FOZ62_000602 [Perkinsus olseni]